MALLFHTSGSRMFVCTVCDKHLDLEDNEGGHYNACKEHVKEAEALRREIDRKYSEKQEEDRKRWFDNWNEVHDHSPACPHCFKEFYDWYECFKDEDGYETELECGNCEKTFKAVLHKEYAFTTTRKEDE